VAGLPGDYYPEGIQEALGNVVVLWSNVEAELARAILNLGYLADLEAAKLLVAELDVRSRISALKGICYIEMNDSDFDEAEEWLNHLDGNLRTHRNRLIHDEWSSDDFEQLLKGEGRASRDTVRTRIVREPPSGRRLLQTRTSSRVSAADIAAFCHDLNDARTAISRFVYYGKERGFSAPLPPLASRYKSSRSSQGEV
jgi:hypothetical protein